jgi:hypothetical protein
MVVRYSFATCLIVMSLAAGCGAPRAAEAPKPAALVPVSGKVTLNGAPLEGALLVFFPAAAGGFQGQAYTDSTGVYHAETRSGSDLKPGVAPGSYRVMVSRFLKPDGTPPLDPTEPPANSAARESLPPDFSSPTNSKLRAIVGAEGGTFDFQVKTK